MGLVSRIACLFVPALPLQALLRAAPGLQKVPLAITLGQGARDLIRCTTTAAAGVVPGMTTAEARAVCPELQLRRPSPALIASAEGALLDLARSFSPLCELGPGEGEALLEIGDLGRLHQTEESLGQALLAHATHLHLTVQVCIATSAQVARIVARTGPGIRVLPVGMERSAIADLPIEALPLRIKEALILRARGLRRIGDLAALPEAALAHWLGPSGEALRLIARGEDRTPLHPAPVPELVSEALDLDGPPGPERFWLLLRGLLDRLLERLALWGLGCDRFRLRLDLRHPDGRLYIIDEREMITSIATTDGAVLLDLLRSELGARPPSAPVRRITVWTARRALRPMPLLTGRPAPEKLSTALFRLEALFGPEHVGANAVVDSYLEDQVHLLSFPREVPSGHPGPLPPLLLLRMRARVLRPPRPAEVLVTGGTPIALRSDLAVGRVLRYSGPLRARVGFGGPVLREYYDIELLGGVLLRIFQDLSMSSWSIEAVYEEVDH